MKKPKKGYKKVPWYFGKEIEIPEEWEVVLLSKICQIRKSNPIKSDLYIGLEHIGQNNNKLTGKGTTKEFTSNSNSFYVNDVLYGKLRPILNKVWLATEEGYCSTDILPLQARDNIIPAILLSILTDYRFLWYSVSTSSGTKMPRTNWTDIKNFLVLLPNLTEQKKIASILSGVDALIETTQNVIDKTERLKKGLMEKLLTRGINHTKFKKVLWMFGKEIEIPEEWGLKRTSGIMNIKMGQSPPSIAYNENQKGLPFYQGVSDFGEMFPNPTIWCVEPKKIAAENSILFSVRAPVGETNLTKSECCIGRGIASLEPLNQNDLFYCFYLINYNARRFLIYSQGTTYDSINKDEIKNTQLLFTSNLTEQKKIASILSGVDAIHNSFLLVKTCARLAGSVGFRGLRYGLSPNCMCT